MRAGEAERKQQGPGPPRFQLASAHSPSGAWLAGLQASFPALPPHFQRSLPPGQLPSLCTPWRGTHVQYLPARLACLAVLGTQDIGHLINPHASPQFITGHYDGLMT